MSFSLHNDLYFSAPRLTSIDLYVPSLSFKTINNVPSGQKIPILILSTSYLYFSQNNVNPIIFLLYFFNLIFVTRIPARKASARHTTNVPIFNATILFAFLCFQLLQLFINFIIFHFLIQTLFLHNSRTFINDPSSISSFFLLFNSVTYFL